MEEMRPIRPILKSLVGLDLHAEDRSHCPKLIDAWKGAFQQGTAGLPPEMAPPKSQAWITLAQGDPNTNGRNAAQVQLLWELRQALRRRTGSVPSSLSFQSRAAMLDSSGSTITAARASYPVKTMIKALTAEIDHG